MSSRALAQLAFLAVTGIALSARAADSTPWRHRLEQITLAPQYRQARWGLLVAELDSGQVLYESDADKLFAPASVTKLYSVAAALEAFGSDYRFETPVYARGALDADGQLHGDLILVAKGDLTFGGRTDPEGHIAFKNTDHIYANDGESAEWTAGRLG